MPRNNVRVIRVPSLRWAALLLGSTAACGAAAQSFCDPVLPEPVDGAVVLGNGTPGSVTAAQIQAALDVGGAIRFDLGTAPVTVLLDTTLIASRDVVLDGEGLVTLSGGNLRRILEVENPDPAPDAPQIHVTLQNIELLSGRTAEGRGGAIYKRHDFEFPHKVNLKLVNCRFRGNRAELDGTPQDDGGGAFYGELLNRIDIGNCVFDENVGSNGGAVYSLGSLQLNIVDSHFLGNSAIGSGGNPGNGGNAGALGVDGAAREVDICRTRLIDNQSNAYGGGFFTVMYDDDSHTRFEDVEFRGNLQIDAGQHTGGAYIQGGPWAMERVSFVGNDARGYGGLFVAGNAPGTIRNGTFSNNVARTGLGAAMALTSSAPITIVNSSIANNVATEAFAAGIAIDAPNQLRLANVVFDNNTGGNRFVNWAMNNPAAFDGGGNLQWPQTRPQGGGNETPVTASVQFVDAELPASADDHGGAVPTLALADDSPARDAGVSNVAGSSVGVPLRDARGSAGWPVDSGSYEYVGSERRIRRWFRGQLIDGIDAPSLAGVPGADVRT